MVLIEIISSEIIIRRKKFRNKKVSVPERQFRNKKVSVPDSEGMVKKD